MFNILDEHSILVRYHCGNWHCNVQPGILHYGVALGRSEPERKDLRPMDTSFYLRSNQGIKAEDQDRPGNGQIFPDCAPPLSFEDEAECSSDLLYDYPMLYEAVRGPTPEETASLSRILETHLGRQPTSVMDPACGPGTWLEPFARQLTLVAGNDLSPGMVAVARQRLHPWRSEITEGDMRTLGFRSGSFEAAFEMSGALGMLLDVSSMLSFLESLGRVLIQGGVALLDAHFRDGRRAGSLPRVCWSHGPVHLALGQRASVIYEILREDTKAGIEWVRRSVHVQGAIGSPMLIMDEYPIRIWRPEDFIGILARASRFRLEAVYREDGSDWCRTDRDDLKGERLVLLRRVRTESRGLIGGAI